MSNDATLAPARKTAAPRATQKPAPAQHGQAPVAAPLSLSMIVLSLRPNGSKFNGNRIERAQEAGFGWIKNANQIGFSDPDTGCEIARHVINNSEELFGSLKEIQVHVDPEQCAWMWRAGTFLMERLKKYAILIGARICDGVGKPLDDEAVTAIGKHIDEVMARRRDADPGRHAPSRCPVVSAVNCPSCPSRTRLCTKLARKSTPIAKFCLTLLPCTTTKAKHGGCKWPARSCSSTGGTRRKSCAWATYCVRQCRAMELAMAAGTRQKWPT